MNKTVLYFLVFILLMSSNLKADNFFDHECPTEFVLSEAWNIIRTFDIKVKDKKVATVKRQITIVPEYAFFDAEKNLTGRARMQFFHLDTVLELEDADNKLIGMIKGYAGILLQIHFGNFDFFNKSGEHIAEAQLNLKGTKYTIVDPVTKEEIASCTRSFFRLRSKWTVKIKNRALFNEKNIDSRHIISLLLAQSLADDKNEHRD